MGKSGGFLEYGRKEPGYRKLEERVTDFQPVELRMSESDLKAQTARCMDCGTPFCHGCGCPLGNVIPELNDLVYKHRWEDALNILLSTNNFPEFTARICPALCEASCVLGINDEPVTIRLVELAIIEKAFEKGYIHARLPIRRLDQSVAIIGSGPAGLAVADDLNRAGYKVTVYDKAAKPGGVLRYGIPDFKLEKSIVDRRIKLMEEEGVVFECGVSVGDDISFKFLKNRFSAVCLAGGAREPRDLKVPGRDLKGTYFAMEYLVQQNRLVSGEILPEDATINAAGKTVVVIGGGDTGSDCIGTAVRQKAKKIYQFEILPKPPTERPDSTPWPQWPTVLKETSSHKEGGERRWCVNTKELKGSNGILKSMHCVEVEWSKGSDGKPVMKEIAGSDFEIKADLVFLAMGFVGPGRNRIADELGLEKDARGNIKTSKESMTSMDGLFAAGDMSTGQSLVVRAIADGKACAANIIGYLTSRALIKEKESRK